MDMRKRQPIGVELVKRGIVTEKDIEKALEYQREHPNRKLGDNISLDIAKKNKAIPFEVASGKIKVCFANTVNSRVIDTVRLLLLNKGLVMESYITFESDIDKILKSLEGVATSNLEAAGRNDTITGLVDSIIKETDDYISDFNANSDGILTPLTDEEVDSLLKEIEGKSDVVKSVICPLTPIISSPHCSAALFKLLAFTPFLVVFESSLKYSFETLPP